MKRNGFKKMILVLISALVIVLFVFAIVYVSEFIFFKRNIESKHSNSLNFYFSKFYPKSEKLMESDSFKCYGCDNKNEKRCIVVLGCSHVYGINLKDEQTISYKLSKALDIPVYNFSVPVGGLSHVLYMLETGIIKEKIDKEPILFLYFWQSDHNRRVYQDVSWEDKKSYIFYKNKKNKLVREDLSIFEDFYIVNHLKNRFFADPSFLKGNKFASDYLNSKVDETLDLYYQTIIGNTKEQFSNSKFVFVKLDSLQKDYIIDKYENIDLYKKTGVHLIRKDNREKYHSDDYFHPNEAYWDLMSPIIVENLDIK